MQLTDTQKTVISARQTTFVPGPAGCGKTTALHHKLLHLLNEGEPAYTLLVLVSEPTQANHFLTAVQQQFGGAYSDLQIKTFANLAKEFVRLFWPLVARPAGFANAYKPPTWLGYDLAQLLMWEIVTPMLEAGHFANLRLRPQQIVSQLLDNLNRSAQNMLSIKEGFTRQIEAWGDDSESRKHLRDAEQAANQFRLRCQQNNLLDVSLMVEVFTRHVVEHKEFSRYFRERFRHFLVDNLEEQSAAGQHFVGKLLKHTVSTTIAFDTGGGYKTFLAADPLLAQRFEQACQNVIRLDESVVDQQGLYQLAQKVDNFLYPLHQTPVAHSQARPLILGHVTGRYRREMVVTLPEYLRDLMQTHQLLPRDLAIIMPYMDGALRYKLTQSLAEAGIPYQLTRRRASPREEPHVRTWLAWLALAHPDWKIYPSLYDISEAFNLSIHTLDPARAALAAQSLYQPSFPSLRDTMELTGEQVKRLGEENVAKIEALRRWLHDNGSNSGQTLPLDTFIHHLFADLLSQRTFQPQPDVQAGAVCDWLIRTATRLRQAAGALGLRPGAELGRAFINGINNGLVSANPPDLGEPPDPNGVLVTTIYSFLLSEQKVKVQVWLEASATGWWDMPRQPLSNTYVLTQSWEGSRPWTMEDDVQARNQILSRIIHGLTGRCELGVVLATSDLDRRGVRQDGQLWRALQPLLD